MITVVNKYKHTPTPNDVYIGRGSPYGNPYSHMSNTTALYRVANRDEAVDKYREYILEEREWNQELANNLNELAYKADGKDINLVCFCAPKRCHGDVLKELLESEYLV